MTTGRPTPRIAMAELDRLRDRVPLPALVGRAVELRRQGSRLFGLCPFHNERTPSFCVRARHYRCYACGAHGDAIDWLRHQERLDFPAAVRRLAELAGEPLRELTEDERRGRDARAAAARAARDQQDAAKARHRAQDAKALWLAAQPLQPGDMAWRYLAGRGIDLSRLPHPPRALRCHPALWNAESSRKFPALVAAICAPDGNHINTHRIWLAPWPDGTVGKAPLARAKLSMPGGYAGGAVRLWKGASGRPWQAMAAGETLLAGEGIEDVLTFVIARPEWRAAALLSVSSLEPLVLPEQVAELVWLAQNDPRGSAAAATLKRALTAHRRAGRRVRVLRPPVYVKDLNDYAQWLAREPAIEAA